MRYLCSHYNLPAVIIGKVCEYFIPIKKIHIPPPSENIIISERYCLSSTFLKLLEIQFPLYTDTFITSTPSSLDSSTRADMLHDAASTAMPVFLCPTLVADVRAAPRTCP